MTVRADTKAQRSTGHRPRMITTVDVQKVPRFAPPAGFRGDLLAERILEELRKGISTIELRPKRRSRSSRKQHN
jgi:hypothetical protein